MGLNIKNAETEALIRELAAMRGESLVAAVSEAVSEKLRQEKESQRRNKLTAEWLMEIANETGPILHDGRTSKELMDDLYDEETGLPR